MPICTTCQQRYDGALFCPVDGTRLGEEGADRSGERIDDRYELLRLVSRGGMGEVYEANHTYLDKRVALKLLRPEATRSRDAIERLHREARAASAIGHPNIVRVEDFGRTEHGTVYLVMEWLEGPTLEEALAEGPLAPARCLAIAGDICAALAAAHDAGVVHRDLKPANILLVRDEHGDEVVKLLDFGIAKLLAGVEGNELTRTGTFVGTPNYIAPEQALGEDVDHRADLYAVGVILYEMFAGRVPFSGSSVMAVLQKHVAADPFSTEGGAARRMPPAIQAVIARCMEKQPARRYGSARELSAAIARLGPAGAGDSAELDTIEGFAATRPRRGRLAALTVALGIAAGVALWARPWQRAPAAAPPGPDATAPAAPASWRHAGRGDHFDFVASIAPTPADNDAPIEVMLHLDRLAPLLAEAATAGELSITLEFVHHLSDNLMARVHGRLGPGGALLEPIRILLPRRGTYHADLLVRRRGDVLGRGVFELCIGADPHGDPATLAAMCPPASR